MSLSYKEKSDHKFIFAVLIFICELPQVSLNFALSLLLFSYEVDAYKSENFIFRFKSLWFLAVAAKLVDYF